MTPELKPCPFCGHPPYNDEQTAHVFGFRTKHDWAIACSNCEVSAPGAKTLSDAITAWNIRADIAAAIIAAERDACAARLAAAEKMTEALESARETILQLINARGSEAEGSDEEWTRDIDIARAAWDGTQ